MTSITVISNTNICCVALVMQWRHFWLSVETLHAISNTHWSMCDHQCYHHILVVTCTIIKDNMDCKDHSASNTWLVEELLSKSWSAALHWNMLIKICGKCPHKVNTLLSMPLQSLIRIPWFKVQTFNKTSQSLLEFYHVCST